MHPMQDPVRTLAQRLRELRTNGFTGVRLTQGQLATALGVSVPLISSWEKRTPPPVDHLTEYATLFATDRSFHGGRLQLVPDDDLNAEERDRRDRLARELIALRATAVGGAGSDNRPASAPGTPSAIGPWYFPDLNDVTMVCAPLPRELREQMPYTDPDDPDYVELYDYADLDSLLELHGHIRAMNPGIQVNIRLANDLQDDDYTSHLVILGGVDWNVVTRILSELVSSPVRQVPRDDERYPDGAFVVGEGPEAVHFEPVLRGTGNRRVLIEDIAQFVWGTNPLNRKRTVTICNGMFGRGVYAAVRALTDARFRLRNAEYLEQRFSRAETYSILSRVRIVGRRVATPDWTVDATRLHEWPEAA